MRENFTREIVYYRHYYLDFFNEQRSEVKKKLNWTLYLIATVERVPEKYFKHISGSDGIYEVLVEVGTDVFRVFCFFDKGKLVDLANGFQRKTQKTPQNEIEKAERIKTAYFNEKEH